MMSTTRYHEKFSPKALPPPAVIDKIPPPHDLDAEAAVLASVLLDPPQLENVASLQPPHFYSGAHQRIWEAILYLRACGEKIDIVTVASRLKNQGRIADVGGLPAMTEMLNSAPVTSNARSYGNAILTLARLRELAAVVQRVNARCYVDRANPSDVMAEAERLVTDVVRTGFGPTRLGVDQIFESTLTDEPNYVCKGLALAPGRVTLVAGSPDSGKTLAWQSVAVSVASGADAWGMFHITRPGLVVHLNWDQELEATYRRYRKLLAGRGLTADRVRGYLELLDDPPFALDSDIGIAEIKAIARSATMIIIDALTGSMSETDEKDPSVGRWLRKLGKISEQTGCVIVVIHHAVKPPQLKTRGAQERDAMHDVRGSGAIPGASGGVFVQSAIKKGELYLVRNPRPPTNAKRALEQFGLKFEDVDTSYIETLTGESRRGPDAVRVTYVPPEELATLMKREGKSAGAGDSAFEQFARIVLEKIKTEPDMNGSEIHQRFGKGTSRDRVDAALKFLARATATRPALIVATKGEKNANVWRAT